MNMPLRFRLLFTIGGITSLSILGIAYLLEYFLQLEACPLCLLQRYALWGISILFWIGASRPYKEFARLVYCGTITFFCMLGIVFSSRHVWLQYVSPPLTSSCLAGFEKMIAFRSFAEIIEEIFTASPECSRIDFSFLNLPLSAWSLITFLGFTVFIIMIGWLQIKRRI